VGARAGGLDPAQSEGENGAAQSGTGFIWDAAGHVVTNDHVVEGAGSLAVRLASGQVLRAQLVGTAPNYDLAVIRVDNTRSLPPPIAIGSSDDLKVGQWVFAIGNPFGLDQTLTTGIISAPQAPLPTSAGRDRNVIQTDAAINPAFGRPRCSNSAGRVIGVNTAILSPSGTSAGIGYAIPIDSSTASFPNSSAAARCRRRVSASSPPTRRRRRARASKAWSSCGPFRAPRPSAPACAAWTPTPAGRAT
jgi:2-alkenal reductase